MTQSPLPDMSYRPVTVGEDRRIRLERMVEPPVYLESSLGLSVDERITIEEASAQAESSPNRDCGKRSIFVALFIGDQFYHRVDVRGCDGATRTLGMVYAD